MENNNVIDLQSKVKPVMARSQNEILEERRKKRKEKINAVKKKVRQGQYG